VDQLIAIIPASGLNYFLNSYWVYKAEPGRARTYRRDDEPDAARGR